jgi:hypothetical protein
MQSVRQLPRSDQKKLDEVRRIREAMATGGPILTDDKMDEMAEYAKILALVVSIMCRRPRTSLWVR